MPCGPNGECAAGFICGANGSAQTDVCCPTGTDLATVSIGTTTAPSCGAPPCVSLSANVLKTDGRKYQTSGGGDVTTGAKPPWRVRRSQDQPGRLTQA